MFSMTIATKFSICQHHLKRTATAYLSDCIRVSYNSTTYTSTKHREKKTYLFPAGAAVFSVASVRAAVFAPRRTCAMACAVSKVHYERKRACQ